MSKTFNEAGTMAFAIQEGSCGRILGGKVPLPRRYLDQGGSSYQPSRYKTPKLSCERVTVHEPVGSHAAGFPKYSWLASLFARCKGAGRRTPEIQPNDAATSLIRPFHNPVHTRTRGKEAAPAPNRRHQSSITAEKNLSPQNNRHPVFQNKIATRDRGSNNANPASHLPWRPSLDRAGELTAFTPITQTPTPT